MSQPVVEDRITQAAQAAALRVPLGCLADAITEAEAEVRRAADASDRATLRVAHAEARLEALRWVS